MVVLTTARIVNMIVRQMRLPLAVSLIDKGSGERVPGVVRMAIEQDLLLWMRWRYRPSDQDRTWDWWGIYLESMASDGRHECYAALAAEGLHGLMLLNLEKRKLGTGSGMVVDYLSTNPANRREAQGLKYIGIVLIATAITRSLEQGLEGRIWLESLPAAAGFYENLGMKNNPSGQSMDILFIRSNQSRPNNCLRKSRKRG